MMLQIFRTLKAAARLGWQIESNWADPLLFAIYSVIKPLSASLILLVMYKVITQGPTSADLFAYIYVGNAFYFYVATVLFGICWTVVEDREWYETIRYLYISRARYGLYLVGRGFAKTVIATVAVIVTLTFGILVLKIPIRPLDVNYPALIAIVGLGLLSIAALGLVLSGVGMLVPRHSEGMTESVAGIFYLLCGAVFPIDVLPGWLKPLSKALPFTYWLEGVRRVLLRGTISRELSGLGLSDILWILSATALGLCVLSYLVFKVCERAARQRGILDRTSGW
jgi:ABC-2 type transport system permease protein